MHCLGKVIWVMILLLLIKLWLLVLVLVVMMLTPPTLSHLLWLQFLMSSMIASSMMRLPCWQGSFTPYTSSTRRGGDHPGAASSVATPPTSSSTVTRGRSLTPPTSTTTPTRTTISIKVTTRRRTASEIRRRRSFRRSCLEYVLPWATPNSQVKTPLTRKMMRRSSATKVTSLICALWANL
jgi:hypothetical protein